MRSENHISGDKYDIAIEGYRLVGGDMNCTMIL